MLFTLFGFLIFFVSYGVGYYIFRIPTTANLIISGSIAMLCQLLSFLIVTKYLDRKWKKELNNAIKESGKK